MIIQKRLLEIGDPREFMKLAWSINPQRTKDLIKIQLLGKKDIVFNDVNPSDFDMIVEDPDFNLKSFLSSFKSNSKEFIRVFREGKIKAA